MSRRIVIDADPREPIPAQLVGREYLVTPPKSTLAMALATRVREAGDDVQKMRDELNAWIAKAFGPRQSEEVIARLDDADDDLDLPHIYRLMRALTESVTGDPTT